MVQKSGWSHTSKSTDHIMREKGMSQSLNVCKKFLYLLKKYAKYIIKENFKNSVGCMVNGIQGIFIHHLAHFNVIPDIKTITSNIKLIVKKYFEYFSKKVYGILTAIIKTIKEIITCEIFLST